MTSSIIHMNQEKEKEEKKVSNLLENQKVNTQLNYMEVKEKEKIEIGG